MPVSRTFTKKSDGQRWANEMESRADVRDLHTDTRSLDTTTVADILKRYRDEIVPNRRGRDVDTHVINAMLRAPLAKHALSGLTPGAVARFRDMRLKTAKPVTVSRDLWLLRSAFEVARNEWDVPLRTNPVSSVRVKMNARPRDRRLQKGEFSNLMRHTKACRNRHLRPIIIVALETAMRQGELLRIERQHVDFDKRTLLIPLTKNGDPRTIALTKRATRVLRFEFGRTNDARAFPITSESVKNAWQRLIRRADIEDLRFHDLRHEAISRLFERGLSLPEVALISGHKDPRMLFRYTHLKAEDISAKLG